MGKVGKRRSVETYVEPAEAKRIKNTRFGDDNPSEGVCHSDEDLGHSESQQFLAMIRATQQKAEKQSSRFVDKFQVVVEERKGELYQLICEKAENLLEQDSRLQAIFLSEPYNAFVQETEGTTNPLDQSSDAKRMLPPGYQLTKTLIGSAKRIIKEYDHACQATVTSRSSSGTQVVENNDGWKLTNLLEKRRKEVNNQVNGSLYGTSNSSKDASVTNTSPTEENHIWTSFARDGEDGKEHSTDGSKGGYWAKAAKHVERDIRRIVKRLPKDT